MQNFITALKAEHLKRKKTGVYLTAIILGALIPVIYTLVIIVQNETVQPGLPTNYFLKTLQNITTSFTGFFFPMLIIITASRLTQLDHKNGGWQLMETQPVTKLSIYFSKFTELLFVNLTAILTFVLSTYLGCLLINGLLDLPENVSVAFEPGITVWLIIRLFLAGLLFCAVQYAVSVLLTSFIWSIMVGLVLLLGYQIASNFYPFPVIYPMETLSLVGKYTEGSDLGYWITYSEIAGVLCSIIVLYIGFMWYKHKSAKRAFVGNGARIGSLLAVFIVFGGLIWYTTTTNTMVSYTKTVVSGTIESTSPVNRLYLTDNFIGDTIAIIPVKDNKFHQVITKDVPLDVYRFVINGQAAELVLSNKDSVYVELRINKDGGEIEYNGTRIAESQYMRNKKKEFKWSSVAYDLQNNTNLDKPDNFIRDLIAEWKEDINQSDNFKTVDNYVPREDYRLQNKKLLTIRYLNYWNDFIKKRKALYPDQETKPTEGIKEMIASVPLNDEGLLSKEEYFNYLKSQMLADNKSEIDENTKTLQAIEKLEKGSFRDKMLYWQLDKSIKEASTAQERNNVMAKYTPLFSNNNYLAGLNATNKLYTSLEKGNPAPLFAAMDKNQKQYTLNDLKGKYVMIDVWATWCKPCEVQRPNFEKMAIKYKDEPITFIAVSTDKRIDSWYVEVNNRSKSVLQLHLNDIDQFEKQYNVQAIPRFILIDPEGNFVNSEMPFPSEANFEKMLRDALSLEDEK